MQGPWESFHVIELLHDSLCAGHFGIEKTQKRAEEKFYLPCMSRDERHWTESCEGRFKKKSNKQKLEHSLEKWKRSCPYWQISIKWVQLSRFRVKFTYCLSSLFSKCYKAVDLVNQEATNVARAFVQHWIVRIGCLVNLQIVQGLNSMSRLTPSLCSEQGIQMTSKTSYHPQGNALIEKTSRREAECLSHYIGQNENEWSKFLPIAMIAY